MDTPTAETPDRDYLAALERRNARYYLDGLACRATTPLVAARLRHLLGQDRRFTVVVTLADRVTAVHTSCYLKDVGVSPDRAALTVMYHTAWDGDSTFDAFGWRAEYDTEELARHEWEQAPGRFGARTVYRFRIEGGTGPQSVGRDSSFLMRCRNEHGVDSSVLLALECPPQDVRG